MSKKDRDEKSNREWQEVLSPEQYNICRLGGTEPAGSGSLLHNKAEGSYHCACCDAPLFESGTKFESGTGWPSFFQPYEGAVMNILDKSHGMVRTEIRCANCQSHLGHVFNDGPKPTGMRFCVNSLSLKFIPK